MQKQTEETPISFEDFKKEVLNDFRICCESRHASLIGRKEVLTGKAKFGIFGDGKEVAQIAMAKAFRNGDFRSGYYRDQTFMFATGTFTVRNFFAQLYADPNLDREPATGGRSMNGHFATRSLHPDGTWKDLTAQKNSSADISPTAGQMPRLLGLAYASKLYRQNKLVPSENFSVKGNEVAFGTIGDASTSEGLFWETMNAAGVMQVPMAISVWDDGYGISVPAKYQTLKQNISELLKGFEKTKTQAGFLIFTAKGWDYPSLVEMYSEGIRQCREQHIPVLFHIREMTQPQGHSTSGSHERYKTPERLNWEAGFDCIVKMKEWMVGSGISSEKELQEIDFRAKDFVMNEKNAAWKEFIQPIAVAREQTLVKLSELEKETGDNPFIPTLITNLASLKDPTRKDIHSCIRKAIRATIDAEGPARQNLMEWLEKIQKETRAQYNSTLHSEIDDAAMEVTEVLPVYSSPEIKVDGREVLLANWEANLKKFPQLIIFGEDVGQIGGVNQSYAGLQEKFGELRIHDTGIREATIVGQGIGLALRGFRPVAEIQYLDYLLYAIQILSDDLATLRYRTMGGQKAPLIVSTRGHRLEGIWHSGSPMGMIIHALRGMHVCVPRNMTTAAGFYNTLLESGEPALVIEPLNAYRIKENLPSNPGAYKVPLGVPEILSEGIDITVVSYGSTCRMVQEAIPEFEEAGISIELLDVRTLLPFDKGKRILESVKKTGKILFIDEDVPGGATAYMMQEVLENQGAFQYLDAPPATLTAKPHRPAYGSDGDYFSKPSSEDIFEAVYRIMSEYQPDRFPAV